MIKWAKALSSLTVEEIVSNSSPSVRKYEQPDSFHTHVGFVVVHLGGHRLVIRYDFCLIPLHSSDDEALFDLVDKTNFDEALRVMTL